MKPTDKFLLAESLTLANWRLWQHDFEHRLSNSGFDKLPILNCIDRFSAFTKDYNLSRNIPGGPVDKKGSSSEQAKKRILAQGRREFIMNLVREDPPINAKSIDEYAVELAKQANSAPGLPNLSKLAKRSQVSKSRSLVSKICSFWNPVEFPPFDQYASNALKEKSSYSAYQSKFKNRLLNFFDERHENVKFYENYLCQLAKVGEGCGPAIRAKILDVTLMIEGGLWNNQIVPEVSKNKL
ncbi:hypothetical protein FEE96_16930 [Parasedimentitalea maritima]|uniref:Uncharacterized protein n=1 Tax=Parasedimentitalea maritima TaxID=2578117 RepID=A0ABY2URA5_9RHOB|nr:hypothetical protein [Zongyanglinia marina]TLP59288.1 hypothetical protein FEE96_16930 [Zongyanglinia marina]